jgi:hypothetical protein
MDKAARTRDGLHSLARGRWCSALPTVLTGSAHLLRVAQRRRDWRGRSAAAVLRAPAFPALAVGSFVLAGSGMIGQLHEVLPPVA